EVVVRLRYVGHRQQAEVRQPPAFLGHSAKGGAQEWRRKEREQRLAQPVVLGGHVLTKIHAELVRVGDDAGQAALDQGLQLFGGGADDRYVAQVLDGAERRQRPVATRSRQERDVVAERLVAVITAQVE